MSYELEFVKDSFGKTTDNLLSISFKIRQQEVPTEPVDNEGQQTDDATSDVAVVSEATYYASDIDANDISLYEKDAEDDDDYTKEFTVSNKTIIRNENVYTMSILVNEDAEVQSTDSLFSWQEIQMWIAGVDGTVVKAVIPYQNLHIKFLKQTAYTNSIQNRMAHIPFQVVYRPEGATDWEVINRKIPFDAIKGSDQSVFKESSEEEEDYPFKWTGDIFKPFNDDSNLTVKPWSDEEGNGASIEWSNSDGTYYLNVPFGKSSIPLGYYVEVSDSLTVGDESLGGYYEIVSDVTESLNQQTYRLKRRDGNGDLIYYFLRAVDIKYISSTASSYTLSWEDGWNSGKKAWVILKSTSDETPNPTENAETDNVIAIANNFFTQGNSVSAKVAFASGFVRNLGDLQYESGNITVRTGSLVYEEGTDCVSDFIDGQNQEDGQEKELYFSLGDSDNSHSTKPERITISIYKSKPSKLSFLLTGSSGQSEYTGWYVKNGRFFPSEYISVSFSAESNIDMTYSISGMVKTAISNESLRNNVTYRLLMKIAPYATNASAPLLSPLGTSGKLSSIPIRLNFTVKDEAGNVSSLENQKIMWIPQLYRTRHLNLREPGVSYSHQLSSQNSIILEREVDRTKYSRSWNEIWYPSTHGSPINADGSINEQKALSMAKNGATSAEMEMYDMLAVSNDAMAKDTDGRYMQDVSKWDRTKTYPSHENSRLVNDTYQQYWIIDNSGNEDFQLEFEIFDFSSHITKYPENLCARCSGDSVSVFDASDPECVYANPVVDGYGRKHWVLKDSTKLNHLFTLRGSGFDSSNKPVLVDCDFADTLESTGNGFICPSITTCSRICIAPFTDYGTEDDSKASGFKLKAGPRHYAESINYEYSNDMGEFWVHRNSNGNWVVPSTITIVYDYYAAKASIDVNNGSASFSSRMTNPLLGTFSNYLYLYKPSMVGYELQSGYPHQYFSRYNTEYNNTGESNCIMTFATTQDDLEDYSAKSFFVSYSSDKPIKSETYERNTASNDSSGKFTAFSMDNDTGILTVNANYVTPPRGRLFADYYYHTFYRLTSDGYGDLYFYGNGILVPASSTNAYTDWAYVDLKIVNEGSNTLNDGMLTFLARGYITKGSVVDTVLDMNRPWDVQEGTTAETVNRTGAVYATSFSNLVSRYPANRSQAFSARSSQTLAFGTIEPKQTIFVRVFWCIAQNAAGTAWVDTTRGSKTYSGELSGSYFIFTT